MSLLALLRNRATLGRILRIIMAVARTARTAFEAREDLANRLAEGARRGDFDDSIKTLSASDKLVKDFIDKG